MWITHPIAYLQENNVGVYGTLEPVKRGWNTLSTPWALENPGFDDIEALGDGLDWEIAYYYDPTQTMPWVQITTAEVTALETTSNYDMYPLDGIYLKMLSNDFVFLTSSPAVYAPVRELTQEQSWYLLGPTPYSDTYPFFPGPRPAMPVNMALASIAGTPNGNQGYTQIVSPSIGGQAPWVYVPGIGMPIEVMVQGSAYWAFMENADTYAGFIFTPLPLPLPIEEPR